MRRDARGKAASKGREKVSMADAEVEVSSEELLGWIEGVDETKERTREEDWRMEVGRRRGELDSVMAFSFNLPPLLELD